LNAAAVDGERWIVSGDDEAGWQVVRIAAPGLHARGPLSATSEARPRPPQPDDPRPSNVRAVPPYGGGA
jgi:hypothetical protein